MACTQCFALVAMLDQIQAMLLAVRRHRGHRRGSALLFFCNICLPLEVPACNRQGFTQFLPAGFISSSLVGPYQFRSYRSTCIYSMDVPCQGVSAACRTHLDMTRRFQSPNGFPHQISASFEHLFQTTLCNRLSSENLFALLLFASLLIVLCFLLQ